MVVLKRHLMERSVCTNRESAAKGTTSIGDLCPQENAADRELCCFASFLGLQDEATLGVGIYAYPRSALQRRLRLPPELDFVYDYLDVDAFHEGIQRSAPPRWNVDEQSELPSMVSSVRRRINGWLPIYINAEHWARSRQYAASAFSYMACGKSDVSEFPTSDALNVCCSLLTCAVVGFTKGQCTPASPRASKRGKGSEKAIQMYADVHRLFLQVAHEHIEVQALARKRLQRFIRDPAWRTRERTPNLGDLVQCLLIVEDVTWEQLAPSLLPEALRRHVARRYWEGKFFSSADAHSAQSKESLVDAWDEFAPLSGMVTCFCALFLQILGRPQGRSIANIRASYDTRCGQLREEEVADVVDTCVQVCTRRSALDMLPLMLPNVDYRPDHLGELFLWAEKYGRQRVIDYLAEMILWAEKYGFHVESIPEEAWPHMSGPHLLSKDWQLAVIHHSQREWVQRERCGRRRRLRRRQREANARRSNAQERTIRRPLAAAQAIRAGQLGTRPSRAEAGTDAHAWGYEWSAVVSRLGSVFENWPVESF